MTEPVAESASPATIAETSQPSAPPAPEPARHRRARHAHRARLYAGAIVVIALLIAVIVLSAANARSVEVDWVVGSTETSLVWVVVGATVIGWVLGVTTAAIFRFRTRSRLQ